MDEKLSALETEVAEVISILLEFDSESGMSDDSSITKGCIDRYIDQVGRIGEAAIEARFPGLQDACLLLQENLVELSARNGKISQEERDLLEEWPTLVMGYLTSNEDDSAVNEIIRHLQNKCWANPLPEEFSDVLRSLLVSSEIPSFQEWQPDEASDPDASEVSITEDEMVSEKPFLKLENNVEIANDVEVSAESNAISAGIDTLLEEISKLVGICESALNNDRSEKSLIELYDQQLNYIGLAAEKSGYTGFHELCTLLQENLSYINQNHNAKPNESELNLLEVWPALAITYLEEPTDPEVINQLIEHLQDSAWSRPLPDIYTETLQNLLIPEEARFSKDLSSVEKEFDAATVYVAQESSFEEDLLSFVPSWDELLTDHSDELDHTAIQDHEKSRGDRDRQNNPSSDKIVAESNLIEKTSLLSSVADDDENSERSREVSDNHGGDYENESSLYLSDDIKTDTVAQDESDNSTQVLKLPESDKFKVPPDLDNMATRNLDLTSEEVVGDHITEDETGSVLGKGEGAFSNENFDRKVSYDDTSSIENPLAITLDVDKPRDPVQLDDSNVEQIAADDVVVNIEEDAVAAAAEEDAVAAAAVEEENEIVAGADADEIVVSVEGVVSAEENEVALGLDQFEEESSDSVVSQDFIDLLRQEVVEIADSALKILRPILEENDQSLYRQAFGTYNEELEKLIEVSKAVGLIGLHHATLQIHKNQQILASVNRPLAVEEKELLPGWPSLVFDYLQSPIDETACDAFTDYLQIPFWPDPLDTEQASQLNKLLANVTLSNDFPDDGEERQRYAQAEDVSLILAEEVNPELLDSLLQELPSQTADFSSVIQRFIENTGTIADVDHAQRLAHTLKGAANTVGVTGIANITHHTEDILVALSRHRLLPVASLADTLMKVADCLETMSEALLGMSPPPEDATDILQSVLDWANRIDKEGVPRDDSDTSEIISKTSEPSIVETAEPVGAVNAVTEKSILAPVKKAPDSVKQEAPAKEVDSQTAVPMLRVPAPLIDELLRLVGESIILTGQVQERININVNQAKAVKEQNRVLQQLTAELEQLVDVQGVTTMLGQKPVWGNSDFDPLEFDQYNELHTVTRRLVEIANDARALDENISDNFAALETLIIDQEHLHRDSQEAVLRTRMVPVKTVVPRLQRSVRQTCRLTDKNVDLNVTGIDTLMDTNILSDMLDPLMHVLRNAVDHGIEAPDVRQTAGKPAVGNIDLSFTREGNTIVVRCRDDGSGLDYESIRHVAAKRGLITPDQPITEDELNRLILQSGFSTRKETTQVSGRGIGMDAVYNQLIKIKGSINIQSDTGKGCSVELRLPITLISTHALLIRVRQQVFAVSDRGVEQILHANSGELNRVGDIMTYQMGDDIYEVVYLESLLGLSMDRRRNDRINERPALLVRDETGTVRAVLIEEVIESRDLVVKSMGEYMPELQGILGATILGDGSVTPVLDIPELLRTPVRSPITRYEDEHFTEKHEIGQRTVLIVDDSLSVRRSMQQLVGDAGFEVRTARDGLEAIELLNTIKPDLLLVDLEMPRMNGLELTTHIRAQSKTQQLPIIMITSRSTQKHQREAEAAGVDLYITKPVADDELLTQINRTLH